MRNKMRPLLEPIVWIYIFLPILVMIIFGLVPMYFKIYGDIEVCQKFYPEMKTVNCFFSSKTVRVPGGK